MDIPQLDHYTIINMDKINYNIPDLTKYKTK